MIHRNLAPKKKKWAMVYTSLSGWILLSIDREDLILRDKMGLKSYVTVWLKASKQVSCVTFRQDGGVGYKINASFSISTIFICTPLFGDKERGENFAFVLTLCLSCDVYYLTHCSEIVLVKSYDAAFRLCLEASNPFLAHMDWGEYECMKPLWCWNRNFHLALLDMSFVVCPQPFCLQTTAANR